MAKRQVESLANWLRGPGSHILTFPDHIDYGVTITPPMSRRGLSFGGESEDVLAGRPGGFYVLTPLEDCLTPEERASRLRSYSPYWTQVTSYHEWVGHGLHLPNLPKLVAMADKRPIRVMVGNGIGFGQTWAFYLEKLMEDEGYFKTLPYMEELKTRMARLQMRMWRIQRILTKLKMAKGEMNFEEAVDAYVKKSGMEPTNAYIEVQRDSEPCSPPGSEIIGERELLKLKEEYKRRMGEYYTLKKFHDNLLSHGLLNFKQIRRLMFRD